MAQVEFRVLGGTAVAIDGEVLAIPAAKQRALLAFLLIHRGEVIPPERLLEAVWGEKAPASGVKTLRYHLSMLRRSLGPCGDIIVFRDSGYVLDVPAGHLDSEHFESLYDQANSVLASDPDRAALLSAQALELWSGNAFADCAYEEFAQAEARRLEELRLAVMEMHNDAELAAGRADALVADLEAQVVEHPLREGLWTQLMYALYRTGRQPEALRTLTRANNIFGELGTVPSDDLARLEELILLRDPVLEEGWPLASATAPRVIPSSLPSERNLFVGRDGELQLAAQLLNEVRLLTVLGPPGAGKTRFACRVAADHLDRFPHGVFFIPLAAIRDVSLVEPAVAQAIGVRGGREQSTHQSLVAYLRERHLLLVLDNLEQLHDVGAVVSKLLDVAPELTVLATSRVPIGIHGEQALPIGPLSIPAASDPVDVAGIINHDGVALFLSRARAIDPTFRITDGNVADVAQIVRQLDGLPLAIELAAARIKMLGPAAMRGRLGRQPDLLTGGPQDVVDHHRTLRSAIAWSYDLLSEEEQRFFRSLGVFRGFTLEAVGAVADCPDSEVFDEVASLLDKSLVYRVVGDDGPRFVLLETLREFALGELDAAGELPVCSQRHAEHFAQLVRELGPRLTSARQHEAMASLTAEVGNIRSALRFAIDTEQAELGLEIATGSWRLWDSMGQSEEGTQWLDGLLSLPNLPPRSRAGGLTALAGLRYWQADYRGAWSAYNEALQLSRSVDDRVGVADTLFGMSMTATWDDDPLLGERLAGEALATLEQAGLSDGGGHVLMAKAWATQRQGQYHVARPMWEEALSRARQLGDAHLAITQLIGLAVNEFHIGDDRVALDVALDALDEASSIRNVSLTIWALEVVASLGASTAPDIALSLASAAAEQRQAIGGGMPVGPLDIDDSAVIARDLLSMEAAERASGVGAQMDLNQAYSHACESLRGRVGIGD